MVTVPEETALPPAVTATVRACEQPLSVPAVRVVAVAVCACAATAASAGIKSAKINPATSLSRRPRQFLPLTCTCSKIQNRAPPVCRSLESYCIRRGPAGAISGFI